MNSESNKLNKADIIVDIYKRNGNKDYIGEDITQIEHALQCAYYAIHNNYDIDIIIACLLHDIGHIIDFDDKLDTMDTFGVRNHENIGASFLSKIGFNNKICELVRQHVNAKRYLLTTNIEYKNKLSNASYTTFNYQGGFMTEQEIKDFEQHIYFDDCIKLRYIDDIGKNIDINVGCIDDYYSILMSSV